MNEINISDLDLNLLKSFEALYEEGSASRAGIRLGLTQSAISASLKRLRDIYGDALFVRTGRGLHPTPRANELKPLITDALNKCRETLLLFTNGIPSFAGRTITIGLSDDFELAIGHQLLISLKQQAPDLRIIFRQTHSQIVADMLFRHELDIALTAGGFAYQSLSKEIIAEGRYACLVTRKRSDNNPPLTIDEYISRPHLLISHGGYIGLVDEVLAGINLKRSISSSTTHFAAIPWLLKGSDLIATIPSHAAYSISRMSPDLEVVQCPVEMPKYTIELGFRKSAIRDHAISLVKKNIMMIAASYDWIVVE
jgi:LysR family transcriptional activator of mexEF-oprN operon